MKYIDAKELKIGDIFCKEIKLNGREAFKVIELTENSLLCHSRNDHKPIKDLKRVSRQGILIKLN